MMIIFYHNKFCGVSYDNLSYFLVNEKMLLYFFVLLMICVKFLCHRFFFFLVTAVLRISSLNIVYIKNKSQSILQYLD